MRGILLLFLVAGLVLHGCKGTGSPALDSLNDPGPTFPGPSHAFAVAYQPTTDEAWIFSSAVPGADGYLLYWSSDGEDWLRAQDSNLARAFRQYPAGAAFRVRATSSRYYRVRAVIYGNQTEPSPAVFLDHDNKAKAVSGFDVSAPAADGAVIDDIVDLTTDLSWTLCPGATHYLCFYEFVNANVTEPFGACVLTTDRSLGSPTVYVAPGMVFREDSVYDLVVVGLDEAGTAIGYANRRFKGPNAS